MGKGKGKKGKNQRKGKKSSESEPTGPDYHTIARNGDLEKLKDATSDDLRDPDSHKRTPLHLAAFTGQLEAVNLICEKCPDVALREATDGFLPIHFAAQQGHLSTVKALVKAANTEAGAVKKLMARVVKGKRTLLHIALAKQHIEVGSYLVEKGIDAFALTDKEKLAVDFLDGEHKKKEFLDLLERHKANQERKREAPNVQYERKKLKTDGLAKGCEEGKADEEGKLESKESEHAKVSIDEQAKGPSATASIDEHAKAPPDKIATASIDEQAKAPPDEHTEAPH